MDLMKGKACRINLMTLYDVTDGSVDVEEQRILFISTLARLSRLRPKSYHGD